MHWLAASVEVFVPSCDSDTAAQLLSREKQMVDMLCSPLDCHIMHGGIGRGVGAIASELLSRAYMHTLPLTIAPLPLPLCASHSSRSDKGMHWTTMHETRTSPPARGHPPE